MAQEKKNQIIHYYLVQQKPYNGKKQNVLFKQIEAHHSTAFVTQSNGFTSMLRVSTSCSNCELRLRKRKLGKRRIFLFSKFSFPHRWMLIRAPQIALAKIVEFQQAILEQPGPKNLSVFFIFFLKNKNSS